LVHADRLKIMAGEGKQAQEAGDLGKAVEVWSSMVELLPPGSLQHERITQMLADAQAKTNATLGSPAPVPSPPSKAKKRSGIFVGLGAIGVLLLKLKWGLVFLLGKGKLLLLGLLQAKTFFSMGAAVLVYITAWGWKLAVGLVASMYVHEMGHVARLRHYGIPATAPMFVPGLGAFVRLRQPPRSPAEDARIGMAGPLWGLAASAVFLAVGTLAEWPSWRATAAVGAWINVFNLLPVWQLDGGRAWNALSRPQRGWVTVALWSLVVVAGDGLYVIIALAASLRAWAGKAPDQGDREAAWTYVGVALVLTFVNYVARL
jgi:Zn-dependent protease